MDHDDETPRRAPQAWLDALDRARADVAAGRTVSWADARADFLAAIGTSEAEAKRRA